uniref:CW-type domain-containing protein n=1 Tax=Biomphalaria glabrata TaxID=6526 RepID=A0A2C9L6C5_BIOGL
MASVGGIPQSKVNPKFLHSNSTSHVWVFGAVAELIDNAYDPDVNASQLFIDKQVIGGKECLVFQDNGNGMDKEHLYSMLSFGFCEKDKFQKVSHLPIGKYGNGFKSGSMRLGKDALVFTRDKKTAGVGFLSQTYLEDIKADSVVVPILNYSLPDMKRNDDYESRNCLKAITNHSVFTEEAELIKELEGLKKESTGTKIIIFNLHKLKDELLELDFNSDPKDIKCREVHMKDDEYIEVKNIKKNSSKFRRSLREYCRILFLRPKMRITLRGSDVRAKIISKNLSHTEVDTYRPLWLKKTIQITIGFRCEDHDSEDYGMMLYHNNRLIKAYEKVGYQKQANGMGVGVIGVAEVDFLQPTHIKQDFNVDEKFNTVLKAFADKLNDYWIEKHQEIENDKESMQPDSLWANCDQCRKWRRLPKGTDKKTLPEQWYCYLNEDAKHNRCEDPEEQERKDEHARPSYQKVNKQKQKEKKSLEKQIVKNILRQASLEQTMETGSPLAINQPFFPISPLTPFSTIPAIRTMRKRPAVQAILDTHFHNNVGNIQPVRPLEVAKRAKVQDKKLMVAESLFNKKDSPVKKIVHPDSTLDDNGSMDNAISLETQVSLTEAQGHSPIRQDTYFPTQAVSLAKQATASAAKASPSGAQVDSPIRQATSSSTHAASLAKQAISSAAKALPSGAQVDSSIRQATSSSTQAVSFAGKATPPGEELFSPATEVTSQASQLKKKSESTNNNNSETNMNMNIRAALDKGKNIISATNPVLKQDDKASLETIIAKISSKVQSPSTSVASTTAQFSRRNLKEKKNVTNEVIDVDTEAPQEHQQINFDREKLAELKTKLELKSQMLEKVEERLNKFQSNVHFLLSQMVPTKVIGDVSNIEKLVEEMIELHLLNMGDVKDVKPVLSSISWLPSSSSESTQPKSSSSQCLLS